MPFAKQENGYSLFELIIVIVIIAVLATITMRSLRGANDALRTELTRQELNRLAWAIAGKPDLVTGGTRTDYGYVGDVGSLPPNLDALVENPGGYATWAGPYIGDEFLASAASTDTDFKIDAWGTGYSYTGIAISSTGSGETITRAVANSADDLLYNSIAVTIVDAVNSPPGTIYRDSVKALLTRPNGAGGTVVIERYPAPDGSVRFDSIPIGSHRLDLVYAPDDDTLRRRVQVNPAGNVYVEMRYYREVW